MKDVPTLYNVPRSRTVTACINSDLYSGILVILSLICGMMCAQAQPFAFTRPVIWGNSSNAILRAAVVPGDVPVKAWFEWGEDYGLTNRTESVDLEPGTTLTNLNTSILTLAPAVFCRVVVSNSLGVVAGHVSSVTRISKAIAWGQYPLGQTNAPPIRDVTAVAAGATHGLALSTSGRVAAWGRINGIPANVPAGVTNAAAIAAGANHNLAIRQDGTVVAWGISTATITNVPAGLSNVVAVAGGNSYSLALKADGSFTAWGLSGSATNIPAGLSNVVAVVSGGSHNLALRAGGTVTAWGGNLSGQCNVPIDLTNVVAVAAGASHSLALRIDGSVIAWGGNAYGQALVPPTLTNVTSIAAGNFHSLALTTNNAVIGWGHNSFAQSTAPAGVHPAYAIAAGNYFSVAAAMMSPDAPFAHTLYPAPISSTSATLRAMVTPNGFPTEAWFEYWRVGGITNLTAPAAFGLGMNPVYTVANTMTLEPDTVYECRVVASNSIGVSMSLPRRFTTGRTVGAWGTTVYFGPIIPLAELTNVVRIAAGDYHGLALTARGELFAFGSRSPSPFPYVPEGISNVLAFAGGRAHSVAARDDGTVVAWGDNLQGQTNVPAGLTNVIEVSAGDAHCLALRADGSVAGWGRFGSGEFTQVVIPSQVANVVAIASGDENCMALLDDGTAVLWQGSSPTALPANVTNVVAIAADYQHNLVLRRDGTVVDWGNANSVAPAGLSNVISIASGDYQSMALKADGTLVTWPATNSPAGLSDIVAIACGDEYQVVLAGNQAPRAFARTVNGPSDQRWSIGLITYVGPLWELNGDPVTARIASLPESGQLFQYVEGSIGSPISEINTVVSDLAGRVMFMPDPGEFGVPYTTFEVIGNDGFLDSIPATVTVGVVPPPSFDSVTVNPVDGSVTLSFAGLTNVTYSIHTSTNLVNWTRMGAAAFSASGSYSYTNAAAGYDAFRFYLIRVP